MTTKYKLTELPIYLHTINNSNVFLENVEPVEGYFFQPLWTLVF